MKIFRTSVRFWLISAATVYKTNGNTLSTSKGMGSAELGSYEYDEQGRRIRSTVKGEVTNFFYDGEGINVLYETDANSKIKRSYTYSANGKLLSTTDLTSGTPDVYFYTLNAHGDVVAVTDRNNEFVAQYTYDAWGNIVDQTGPFADANSYRYASYRYDAESGLYYLNARYYNPEHGRFISPDPKPGQQDDPITQNMYTYARNNPVMLLDPDGQWFVDAAFLIYDVSAFIANPSWANAGWIAVSAGGFLDPTGTFTTVAHAAKAEKIFGTYKAVKKATKGLNKSDGIEVHHLVEKRAARVLQVRSKEMWSVAITKDRHQIFTNRWAAELPKKPRGYKGDWYGQYAHDHIVEAAQKVYYDEPLLLDQTLRWLDEVKK